MNTDSHPTHAPVSGEVSTHTVPQAIMNPGQFQLDDLSQAQAYIRTKSQELEAQERKISEMWAKIQNWESRTEEMRLRAEKAEEQAKGLTQQLASTQERALAAETYLASVRHNQQAHPVDTISSPFHPLPEPFSPDADSSMRHESEVEPQGSAEEENILFRGKEREWYPGATGDRHQDANGEEADNEDRDAAMDADGEETDDEDRYAAMVELQPTAKAINLATMKFPPSIIGAGPSLRLKTTAGQKNTGGPSLNSQFGRISEGFPHVRGSMSNPQTSSSSLEQAVIALTGCVTKLTEQMSHLSGSNSSIDHAQRKTKYGAPRSALFKLPPQRHTTPQRNDQLRAVRETMNTLFNIKHDADIVQANWADEDAIEAYEEERGPGPTPPYAPDWVNIESPWNYALFEVFMEEYTTKYVVRDEEQQEDICKMFMDRLRRLKKQVKQATRRAGETNVQMNHRLLIQHRRILLNQRRNSRRNERFSVRSRITVQNSASQKSGDGRVIWRHLDEVVATLGAGGMSSDESDVDDDGQKVYFAKKMSWRRVGLVARMITIDRDRNFKNCYENITGNAPRPRKRRVNATETSRRPIPGLPINFYDDAWYKHLDERQKKLLGAKAALDLIEFERVEG